MRGRNKKIPERFFYLDPESVVYIGIRGIHAYFFECVDYAHSVGENNDILMCKGFQRKCLKSRLI